MYLKKSGKNRVIVTGLLFTAVVFLMLCPEVVIAHSPSEVKLDYDLAAQTLQATITHTRFSDEHYINKVEIRKNGNLVSLQEYKNQPAETFVYSYKVTATAGDTLEVTAYCSKFGSKTAAQKVGQSGKSAPI
jgi:desulfoferrodoxin (superoxide reductase-like protein)